MSEAPSRLIESLHRVGAKGRARLLFVSHGWGGGVERHVSELIASLLPQLDVMLLRSMPQGRAQLSWHTNEGTTPLTTAHPGDMSAELDAPTVNTLPRWIAALTPLNFSRAHLHHVDGWSREVLDLLEALGVPLDVTLHDYFVLTPRYHVLDELPASAADPVAPNAKWGITESAWRERFDQFLRRCERIIAPSEDVANRVMRYTPGLKIVVWPHFESAVIIPSTVKVALLGALSVEKGLRVMEAVVSQALQSAPQLTVRLIGHAAEPLPLGVTATGSYRDEALGRHLADERADVLWFPAQVAETFSYTMSAAMATGLPIVASAVGALPERLGGYPRATLLPPDATATAWIDALLASANTGPARSESRTVPRVELRDYLSHYTAPLVASSHGKANANASILIDLLALPLPKLPVKHRAVLDLFRVGVHGGHGESLREVEHRLEALPKGEAFFVGASEVVALETSLVQSQLAHQADVERYQALGVEATAHIEHLEETRAALTDALDSLNAEHGQLAKHYQQLQDHHQQILASRSWQLTRPLRVAARASRRLVSISKHATHLALHSPDLAARLLRLYRRGGLRGLWARSLVEFRRAEPAASADEKVTHAMLTAAAEIADLVVSSSAAPVVSIVIPVYGQHRTTFACIKSIAEHPPKLAFEIVIGDDASPEPAATALAQVKGIHIIRHASNLGFIGNVNTTVGAARGQWLVILNNDTIVTPGAIDALIEIFAQHRNVGMVGAKLLNRDGSLQEAGGIIWRDGSGWNWGRNERASDPRFNFVRDVDYCSGAALAIERALFAEMGGFDTHFAPAYYEDTDLAFRLRARGLRVLYQPASEILHLEGVSHGRDESVGVKAYQAVNAKKFFERWAETLATHRANGEQPELEAHRSTRGNVLVIEACMVTPDQDSGSVRMLHLLDILRAEGHHVTFVADNLEYRDRYGAALEAHGIEVLHGTWAGSVKRVLSQRGRTLDAVIVCRHYIASKHIADVRRFAPQARLIFDTVDLHFLREEREAALLGNAGLQRGAASTRAKELAVIAHVDVTIVVSQVELELLKSIAPQAKVEIVSNIHQPASHVAGFADRNGILFVGGFRHPPNVDAVRWFATEVVPLLRQRLPGVKTTIVGSNMVDEVLALQSGDVDVVGFVPSTEPYLNQARVSIAPLRYGAGVKGKVNEAMSHGLPVVATPCAVEGMHVQVGEDVLVAESAEDFAAAIERLYNDSNLWQRVSDAGRQNVAKHFSAETVTPVIRRVMGGNV